jgi:hypothetical protein
VSGKAFPRSQTKRRVAWPENSEYIKKTMSRPGSCGHPMGESEFLPETPDIGLKRKTIDMGSNFR